MMTLIQLSSAGAGVDGLSALIYLLYMAAIAIFVTSTLIGLTVGLLIDIVLYILFGYGIKKTAAAFGVAHPGGAYLPFYRKRIFANTADAAAARLKPTARRLSGITFWSFITAAASLACLVLCALVFLLFAMAGDGAGGILHGAALAAAWSFVALIVIAAVSLAATLTSLVFTFIAYARIFKYYSSELWILWIILSILLPPAGPIIIACLAKWKTPSRP